MTNDPSHVLRVEQKVAELADSGLYSHITMNRAWRTASQRKASSDLIPDIIAVGWDGKIVPFEVQSGGDEIPDLVQRLKDGMATVPDAFKTDITDAVNIIPLPPKT